MGADQSRRPNFLTIRWSPAVSSKLVSLEVSASKAATGAGKVQVQRRALRAVAALRQRAWHGFGRELVAEAALALWYCIRQCKEVGEVFIRWLARVSQ